MGRVAAVCVSPHKGTPKKNVQRVEVLEDFGLKGDAHGGSWHRQVSLLPEESIEGFRARGADVEYGAFGENLVIRGYDLKSLPLGTRFCCGEAVLVLTQVGKECHHGCAIQKAMGDCIMPREGVFCKVEKGGFVRAGDEFFVL